MATTGNSGAQEAAVLSPEQQYRIGQAAGQSGRDVEEALEIKVAALQAALEQGHDFSLRRSLRQVTAAVAAVERALRDRATAEEWDGERLQEAVTELRSKVAPTLNNAMRVSEIEDAVAKWCTDVRTAAQDGCAVADPVLKERSEDYTVSETVSFLRAFGEYGRKMELLLAAPAAAGWGARACIEEAKVELRAALDTMAKATEWIKRVQDGLPEEEAVPEPRWRPEPASSAPPTGTMPSPPSWTSGTFPDRAASFSSAWEGRQGRPWAADGGCLLYTSDAADE